MAQVVAIGKVHEMVWAFRGLYGGMWPTPGRMDALRFAFCESAEAMDAWLRGQPQYSRNRLKELDVLDELADTAIMLVTALGYENLGEGLVEREPVDLDAICGEVAFVHRCWRKGFGEALVQRSIRLVVAAIALYPGMELEERVAQRLERIRRRVTAQAVLPMATTGPGPGAEMTEYLAGYVTELEG
jgi:hypothetical protein